MRQIVWLILVVILTAVGYLLTTTNYMFFSNWSLLQMKGVNMSSLTSAFIFANILFLMVGSRLIYLMKHWQAPTPTN